MPEESGARVCMDRAGFSDSFKARNEKFFRQIVIRCVFENVLNPVEGEADCRRIGEGGIWQMRL